jgi:hypothetical protein
MKRIVLIFGVISGVICSALMLLTVYLSCNTGVIDYDNGVVVGYTGMVIAFSLVFFGVRSYRESAGGTVTFGRAFTVGILIALISCAFYVVSWEVIYFNDVMPDFWAKMSEHELARMKSKGVSAETLEAKRKELAEFKKQYDNPLINAAFTFIEPFPVGLLAALISAGVLRRREPLQPAMA